MFLKHKALLRPGSKRATAHDERRPLTVATIWLIPYLEDAVGWSYAFLALGPALGIVAMLRLRAAP